MCSVFSDRLWKSRNSPSLKRLMTSVVWPNTVILLSWGIFSAFNWRNVQSQFVTGSLIIPRVLKWLIIEMHVKVQLFKISLGQEKMFRSHRLVSNQTYATKCKTGRKGTKENLWNILHRVQTFSRTWLQSSLPPKTLINYKKLNPPSIVLRQSYSSTRLKRQLWNFSLRLATLFPSTPKNIFNPTFRPRSIKSSWPFNTSWRAVHQSVGSPATCRHPAALCKCIPERDRKSELCQDITKPHQSLPNFFFFFFFFLTGPHESISNALCHWEFLDLIGWKVSAI